jgi:hypothetical protein
VQISTISGGPPTSNAATPPVIRKGKPRWPTEGHTRRKHTTQLAVVVPRLPLLGPGPSSMTSSYTGRLLPSGSAATLGNPATSARSKSIMAAAQAGTAENNGKLNRCRLVWRVGGMHSLYLPAHAQWCVAQHKSPLFQLSCTGANCRKFCNPVSIQSSLVFIGPPPLVIDTSKFSRTAANYATRPVQLFVYWAPCSFGKYVPANWAGQKKSRCLARGLRTRSPRPLGVPRQRTTRAGPSPHPACP